MTTSVQDLVAAARSRIKEISPAELQAWDRNEFVLIDVREPGEYATGHISGAANVPRGVLEFRIGAHLASDAERKKTNSDCSANIVIYCQGGGRAALATESLIQLGYTNVRSLAGGIDAWRAAQLSVE
ncbi:MAG: sulfurtransferase [Gallionellaceae bacterium]|jgi:rhodanese-related sulfurtransferase|nr:sulfurtransferase [Gallionellaceae bacterium]